MPKRLEDMSVEELWQLFPIILSDHDPEWFQWFEDESALLNGCLGIRASRISHIGSTAIPGLLAKPTVDILVELTQESSADEVRCLLAEAGWIMMSGSGTEPLRMAFNKGYTSEGFAERVLHLHVRRVGDPDELYFRDYLLENREMCATYAALKRELGERFEHDRDAYTDGKEDFVRSGTASARLLYSKRYAL